MSMDGCKHSTPRFSEVLDFQRFSNADINWYMMIPTDLALVDAKVEMLLELCEEEDATLQPTFSMIGLLASTLRWVCFYAEIRIILCLLARFKCSNLVWK